MHYADNEIVMDTIADFSGWQIIFTENHNGLFKRIYCRRWQPKHEMLMALASVALLETLAVGIVETTNTRNGVK